jgi:hypothetical protein
MSQRPMNLGPPGRKQKKNVTWNLIEPTVEIGQYVYYGIARMVVG